MKVIAVRSFPSSSVKSATSLHSSRAKWPKARPAMNAAINPLPPSSDAVEKAAAATAIVASWRKTPSI